jgi:hypothetical protein
VAYSTSILSAVLINILAVVIAAAVAGGAIGILTASTVAAILLAASPTAIILLQRRLAGADDADGGVRRLTRRLTSWRDHAARNAHPLLAHEIAGLVDQMTAVLADLAVAEDLRDTRTRRSANLVGAT